MLHSTRSGEPHSGANERLIGGSWVMGSVLSLMFEVGCLVCPTSSNTLHTCFLACICLYVSFECLLRHPCTPIRHGCAGTGSASISMESHAVGMCENAAPHISQLQVG
jgi:hypothetical protein